MSIEKPNLVFCTETWLNNTIPDSCTNVHNYSFLRKDRENKRGGGVMVYFSAGLKIEQKILTDIPLCIEHICFIFDLTIYLLLYIPPNAPIIEVKSGLEKIIENLDILHASTPGFNFCLLGDFNHAPIKILLDGLNLKNIVEENTRQTAILDFVLMSKKLSKRAHSTVKAPLSNSDHNSVYVYIKSSPRPTYHNHTFFDLRNSNIEGFKECLSKVNWTQMFLQDDFDAKFQFYDNSIKNALQQLPTHTVTRSSRDKSWITSLCKHLINLRWQSFRKKDFEKYKHYQVKVREEIQKSKSLWVQKCKQHPSGLWRVVKQSAPKREQGIIGLKHEDESIETFLDRINGELANHFSNKDISNLYISGSNVDYFTITEQEVLQELDAVKTNKASGNDNLPNRLLKESSLLLCQPLCHLYNEIIQTSTFPNIWKISDIFALPKTKPADITKLRPISLLPTVSKIFERILFKHLQPYILPRIKSNQFGFLPKSSTTSCLLNIQNLIAKLLDSPSTAAVSVISFDLKRAFDSIPHKLLVQKLSSFLPSNLCYLILSYISGRFQRIKHDQIRSSAQFVSSGVPQGAILSPILFNIFIDDLDFGSSACLFKYADDATLILPHKSDSTSSENALAIQSMISSMEAWCSKNYLTLNTSKTQIMTVQKQRKFSCNFVSLPHIRILGVLFNKNLKWDDHINCIVKKAAKNIHLIRALKNCLSKKDLITIYKSKILSVLNYSSELFTELPQHLHRKVDIITKRVHSIICHPSCRCALFDQPSEIRRQNSIKLYLKASCDPTHRLHSLIPNKLPKSGKFAQPLCLSERYRKTFIPLTTEIVNNML